MILVNEYISVHLQHPNADDTFIEASNSYKNSELIPLEKLSIPRFKGDSKKYTGFRNLFDTVVHDNPNLRPVVKFTYLKAYLESNSLTLITNLMLSYDNYSLVLKILDNRYSNQSIIAQSHLDELWNMLKTIFRDIKSIR